MSQFDILEKGKPVFLKVRKAFEYGIFKGFQGNHVVVWFPETQMSYKVKKKDIDISRTKDFFTRCKSLKLEDLEVN